MSRDGSRASRLTQLRHAMLVTGCPEDTTILHGWVGGAEGCDGRGLQDKIGRIVYSHLLARVSFPLTTSSRKEKTDPCGWTSTARHIKYVGPPTAHYTSPPTLLSPTQRTSPEDSNVIVSTAPAVLPCPPCTTNETTKHTHCPSSHHASAHQP